MTEPFVTKPAEKPLSVLGERIDVLASHGATGSYEVFVQQGPEGVGPPPHSHDWDEAYYVLEGKLEVQAGERAFTLGPGELAHVPRGTVHSFRLATAGTKFLSMTSHGAASRFFGALDRDISLPPDVPKLLGIAGAHGVLIAPPK